VRIDACAIGRYSVEPFRRAPDGRGDDEGRETIMTVLQSRSQTLVRSDAPIRSRSRRPWRDRCRTAFRGMKLGVRGHSSFFVHFFFSVLVLAAATVLHCDLVQWCLLLGCIGMVLVAELFSSALEALFRGLDGDSQERARPCLDIAAGAVLLAGITAGVIGSLIFLSRLIEMCAPLFESGR
jgi:diacylglycerol kinase